MVSTLVDHPYLTPPRHVGALYLNNGDCMIRIRKRIVTANGLEIALGE